MYNLDSRKNDYVSGTIDSHPFTYMKDLKTEYAKKKGYSRVYAKFTLLFFKEITKEEWNLENSD